MFAGTAPAGVKVMSKMTGVMALACGLLMAGLSAGAQADGRVVDKVYHPYV